MAFSDSTIHLTGHYWLLSTIYATRYWEVFPCQELFLGGRCFYQWRFTLAESARELSIGGFEVLEVRPIHKRQGVLRSLHHEFGMPINWLVTRGLSAALSPLLPGALVAHMVLAAARKVGGNEQPCG